MSVFITQPEAVGPGIPLAVKDLFDTAGMRTTYGSAVFAAHVPDRTAAAVTRLEAAGYATAGKSNLHEFAYGITSHNPHYGAVDNPIVPGRTAGGSSSGSAAAVAAGLVGAALGSDTGGSIRLPAACCGVVGFKPSYGLVPLDGCFPLVPSFDHAGPIARDVAACSRMMDALTPELGHMEIGSLRDLEVGTAWLDLAEPTVRERLIGAAKLFPRRRALDFPEPASIGPVFMREAAESHAGLFPEQADAYGPNVRTKLERCVAVSDAEYEAGLRLLEEYRERAAETMAAHDLLLTPTLGFVAPPAFDDDREIREEFVRFTFPFNALGWPALAMPCGPADQGLPASVQLVGPPGSDALVLAAGKLLERELANRIRK